MDNTDPQWAIVSLLGHNTFAGILTEVEHFGTKMGLCDVPVGDGHETHEFGGNAVYEIKYVTEDVARAYANRNVWPIGLLSTSMIEDHRQRELDFDNTFDNDAPFIDDGSILPAPTVAIIRRHDPALADEDNRAQYEEDNSIRNADIADSVERVVSIRDYS